MALVQSVKGGQKTFAEIVESLLSMALNEGTSDHGSRSRVPDLEGSGSCLTSFTVTSRGSTVLCTARKREQMRSTSCDTGCSA